MKNIQEGKSLFLSDDKWKVSLLTGNSGIQANVTLWIYGDEGIAGPVTLGQENREQLFLPGMKNEFQVAGKSLILLFCCILKGYSPVVGRILSPVLTASNISLMSLDSAVNQLSVYSKQQKEFFSLSYLTRPGATERANCFLCGS